MIVLILAVLVGLNESQKVGASVTVKTKGVTTKKPAGKSAMDLNPADIDNCEGVNCPNINDLFFLLQFKMKELLNEKLHQSHINAKLQKEKDERNALIARLQTQKQEQKKVIANFKAEQERNNYDRNAWEDERDNKIVLIQKLKSNQERQMALHANLTAELDITNTVIASLELKEEKEVAINGNLVAEKAKITAANDLLLTEKDQNNVLMANLQSQMIGNKIIFNQFALFNYFCNAEITNSSMLTLSALQSENQKLKKSFNGVEMLTKSIFINDIQYLSQLN